MSVPDTILEPLEFRNIRINFEAKYAESGVGAIISAHAPVDVRGILTSGLTRPDSTSS